MRFAPLSIIRQSRSRYDLPPSIPQKRKREKEGLNITTVRSEDGEGQQPISQTRFRTKWASRPASQSASRPWEGDEVKAVDLEQGEEGHLIKQVVLRS